MPLAEKKYEAGQHLEVLEKPLEDGLSTGRVKSFNSSVKRRIKTKDLSQLTSQLANLLRAGMPLVPALSALVEQLQAVQNEKLTGGSEPLLEIMRNVRDRVSQGQSLSGALAEHPDVFSPLFVNTIAAGEASGMLENVLYRLSEMLQNRLRVLDKVKTALAYPAVMTAVALGVVVFLLCYVVPSITQIFIEMNQDLPWPTRVLISVSSFIKSYLLLAIVFVFALSVGITAACKSTKGRLIVDGLKLKMPLFGPLLLKLEIARLTRTLAILLDSGVPILKALQISKGIVHNYFIANALDSVGTMVSKGENIAGAVRRTGLFPPIVFHILSTGQNSANLEQGLTNIADMYDEQIETTSKTLTSLLEPAILLIMGVVVGFIVLSILLPIFEINQAI